MIEQPAREAAEEGALTLDTCWKTIGVRGDHSCPRLAEYVRCLNCPVFAEAASVLLDRYNLGREPGELTYPPTPPVLPSRSLVVFRLGEEWLALATHCLVEIAPQQPVHSLPHQRARALLGVCNVRGALVPCIALHDLLGIGTSVMPPAAGRVSPRLLILAVPGGAVVAPVDEVAGIQRLEERLIQASARSDKARFTLAVVREQTRTLRILEESALLAAIAGSLT
jgi:chemotaxis-related protein WspD